MPARPSAHRSFRKNTARKVVRHLRDAYPDAGCALVHRSAFELLIATILSAQCTDARVNQVTSDLFRKVRSPADFARLPLAKLEKAIRSTGFFRNKARNIKACCQMLVENYDGRIPRDLDQLVTLPGIGRKTANVVLGTAFGLATGVVVDTHVARLSRRLGLTDAKDPQKIEQDLIRLIPRTEWVDFSHRMIHHGRQVCGARKPRCDACSMQQFCPKNGLIPSG